MSNFKKTPRKRAAKHAGGRQSLSGSGPTKVRSIKVPDAEWEAWRQKAQQAGYKSLSEWLRKIASEAQ